MYLRKLASTWFFNLSCISKCFRKHWISKSVESFRNHFMCDLFHLWFIEKKISLAACLPITLRNVFPGGISFVLPRYLQPITSPFHQEQIDLNRVWSIASKNNFQWTISDTVVVLFYTCSSTDKSEHNLCDWMNFNLANCKFSSLWLLSKRKCCQNVERAGQTVFILSSFVFSHFHYWFLIKNYLIRRFNWVCKVTLQKVCQKWLLLDQIGFYSVLCSNLAIQ